MIQGVMPAHLFAARSSRFAILSLGFILCGYVALEIGVVRVHLSQLLILLQQFLLEGLLLHKSCLLSDHMFPHELYFFLNGQEILQECLFFKRKW